MLKKGDEITECVGHQPHAIIISPHGMKLIFRRQKIKINKKRHYKYSGGVKFDRAVSKFAQDSLVLVVQIIQGKT
jgi:hypothetical protein